jgi:hypothetical protein
MRLDAVFVVAPKPQPPSMSTRRAFLIAGGTFATGALLGGACGYSIGAAVGSSGPASPPPEPDLVPSGDVELDYYRSLAVKAPISELVQERLNFLNALTKVYPRDEVLWRGVARLCDEVAARENFPDRSVFSRWIAQIIEGGDPQLTRTLRDRIASLKKLK